MSRLHRAVEKAEREGLLEWTQPLEQHAKPRDAELDDVSARARSGADQQQRDGDDRTFDPAAPRYDTPDAVTAHAPSESVPSASVGDVDGPLRGASERIGRNATATPFEWTTIDEADIGEPSLFSPLFVAASEPTSAAAEQYRLLQTRLEARDDGRRMQVLLVTSPGLGDGKTTTSANLALTMAREFQHRVVLVEADLRRPILAAQFGLELDRGLVDVLLGGLTLDEALVRVPGHQLMLLAAGPEAARSTELIASSIMPRVLEMLRARFDRIVIDTTPMALADTHVLARMADGVLVVVRAGVTSRPALERTLSVIDRDRLLGIVLNEVDASDGVYSYPGLEYSGGRGE